MQKLYIWLCLASATLFTLGCSDQTRYKPMEDANDAGSDTDVDADADSDVDTDTSSDTVYEGPTIPETCADAQQTQTSVGCDFFMADLDLSEHNGADSETYAVVVSNPQIASNAMVQLEDKSGPVYTTTLAPGELEVIPVSCHSDCLLEPLQFDGQGIGVGTGVRLTADVPVLAYQWNPYGVDLFSTDASLLIPVTSLGQEYIATTWGYGLGSGLFWSDYHCQVTLVATEDNTQVTFVPSVDLPNEGGLGPFPAGAETSPILLNAFDVLTITSAVFNEDLTGTLIKATKTVVAFGTHPLGNVPDSSWTWADALQEQMLPFASWGTEYVLARHAPRSQCTAEQDPALWRIVAGADDMKVVFDPPVLPAIGTEHVFTEQGEVLEFISTQDHYAEGIFNNPPDPLQPAAPLFAYQLMTGQSYASCGPIGSEGDPMMVQTAPAGQYLDRYVFNTDDVFDFHFDHIIIVRPQGTAVTVECLGQLADAEFQQVGSSSYEVARVFLDTLAGVPGCHDGTHRLTAEDPVGVTVVGVAESISYGYLAGVALRPINPHPYIE